MQKVKVCGITNLSDAIMAQSLGAWALGFIFYEKSKRYIEPKRALEIIEKLDSNIKTVGVFVNEDYKKMNEIALNLSLDFIQLHGLEDEFCAKKLIKPYIKNIRSIDEVEKYNNTSIYLTDALDTKNWGGVGKLCDWTLASEIKKLNKPLMLAGGINIDNIEEAINKINPDVIDISSGLEETYGIKNHNLMKSFFDKIKNMELRK